MKTFHEIIFNKMVIIITSSAKNQIIVEPKLKNNYLFCSVKAVTTKTPQKHWKKTSAAKQANNELDVWGRKKGLNQLIHFFFALRGSNVVGGSL